MACHDSPAKCRQYWQLQVDLPNRQGALRAALWAENQAARENFVLFGKAFC
jgi:hypothetical protein